ncbi:MAG: GIY-YIG nuclease family protein [Phycisphaerales bacterium]|jgi:hypothetical protein
MSDATVDDLVQAPPFAWEALQDDAAKPPRAAGCYAWWFREAPGGTPIGQTATRHGLVLLYVGISPRRRSSGVKPSKQNLRSRIRYHYRGNAEGSTLRLSLGCLLSERLGIHLRRVGSGSRLTFNAGELVLSNWMRQNALVGWIEHARPEELEEAAIARLNLPLNLEHNKQHEFYGQLSSLRAAARQRAKALPVWMP